MTLERNLALFSLKLIRVAIGMRDGVEFEGGSGVAEEGTQEVAAIDFYACLGIYQI